jgi:hypothetical protein
MTFRVGQKVVCVDASGSARHVMKEGDIFTVVGHGMHPNCVELDCKPINDRPGACGWMKSRFRPVVERKTDISIFTEILRKASTPARGPAVTSPHGAST